MSRNVVKSAQIMAEVVVFVSLATALSYIKVFSLPQGGSVTAGSMVPLIWLSLRRGPKIGIFACAVYGMVQLALEPFIFNPAQVLLDYPIAFGVLGFAGFFKKWPATRMRVPVSLDRMVGLSLTVAFVGAFIYELTLFSLMESVFFLCLVAFSFLLFLWLMLPKPALQPEQPRSDLLPAMLGATVGITGRFIAHFLSGVWFFPQYAPEGMSPIVYSAIYNGSYLLPELIVALYFMYLIAKSKLLRVYE